MDEQIAKALDELYSAFAHVRKPRLPSSVPMRPDPEWIGGQPLRELPAEAINYFASELASGLIGDAEDVRYFAPRLLDLAYRGELNVMLEGPILIALALRRAGWTAWSNREQDAIRAFLEAFMEWCIPGRRYTATEILRAIAILYDDLAPWLARIRAHQDVAGVFVLLWLAQDLGADNLRRRKRPQPFLEKRAAQEAQLRAWLRDSASFTQVNAVREKLGPTGPDGEDLQHLFDEVTYWLHICGAEPA